jgi:hypothetical protein
MPALILTQLVGTRGIDHDDHPTPIVATGARLTRLRAKWPVAAVVVLVCLGSPAVASAHGLELVGGPIALSGVIVGIAGGLACALLRRDHPTTLAVLLGGYTLVATIWLLASTFPGEGLSVSLLVFGMVLFSLLGGLPLTFGFVVSAKALGSLLDRLRR